jgi:hypothetical protein
MVSVNLMARNACGFIGTDHSGDRQMPKGGHRRRGNHPEERHHRQFAVPTYVKNRSIAALIDDR